MTRKRLARTTMFLAGLGLAVPLIGGVRSAPPADAGICVTLERIPDRPPFVGAGMPWPGDTEEACIRIGPTG